MTYTEQNLQSFCLIPFCVIQVRPLWLNSQFEKKRLVGNKSYHFMVYWYFYLKFNAIEDYT